LVFNFKGKIMVNNSSLLQAKGTLELKLLDQFGNVIENRTHNNLVVTAGLGFITSRMQNATATAMTHMAIGTSSTAAAAAQTTLVAETAGARVALDSTTIVTTTVTNDTIQYVATFGAGVGTAAITEAGLFNASSAGTMLCRTVFAVINKGANDTLVITWKISLAAV
jgi:hypothetical protein